MTALRFGALIVSVLMGLFLVPACTPNGSGRNFYSSPEMTASTDSVGKSKGLAAASNYLDSLYKALPGHSAADKITYYREKIRLITHDPAYASSSPPALPIPYLDTIAALIRDAHSDEIKKVYAEALLGTGNYLFNKGQHEKAKSVLAEARIYGMMLKDTCYLYDVTLLFGYVVSRQRDFKRAAVLTREALQYQDICQHNPFFRKQRALDDLGFFYMLDNKFDSAIYYHKQAVQFVEANKAMQPDAASADMALQNIYSNLAVDYRAAGNIPLAIEYFNRAANKALFLKDTVGMAENLYELARTYLKISRIDSVKKLIKQVDPYVERMFVLHKSNYYRLRIDLADSLQNQSDQAYFLKKRIVILDSSLKDANLARSNDPELEYERLDKKYQTDILQRDSRIQRNKAKAIGIIGSILLVGIFLAVFLLNRMRKLIRKKDELNHALKDSLDERDRIESELRDKELFTQEMELNMEFQVAILEQRRQISDDMHDELSSSLAALKFYVSDLQHQSTGTSSETMLSDIVAEVSTVYESARNYMHSLKSNDWQTRFSLIGFLQDIRLKFQQKNLMTVTLDIDPEAIQDHLTTQQHDQLYHIIKECLTNIIKHANASAIEIQIGFNQGSCLFTVTDNGKGFDTAQAKYGIGIESIKSRMAKINGSVRISSSASGTIVSGIFPVV